MITVSKRWQFDAAHQIPHHDGKCANEHGHTYTVTVEATGPVAPVDGRPDGGMVVDFYWLTKAWKEIEPQLDHRNLNETLSFLPATTSEHLAEYLLQFFTDHLRLASPHITVTAVTVSETPSSWAKATP